MHRGVQAAAQSPPEGQTGQPALVRSCVAVLAQHCAQFTKPQHCFFSLAPKWQLNSSNNLTQSPFKIECNKGWNFFSMLSSSSGDGPSGSWSNFTVFVKYFNVPDLKANKLSSPQDAVLLLAVFTFIHIWYSSEIHPGPRTALNFQGLMLTWTEYLQVLFLSVGIGL